MGEPAVADHVDAIDEPAGRRLDRQGTAPSGRHDAALDDAVERGEQVDVRARQGVRAPRPHRRPQRLAVVALGVDGGPAVAVGAGEAAVMVGVPDNAEDVARPQSVRHRRPAVDRSHRMQVGAIGLGGLGAAVHGDHLDEGRERRIEALPVKPARPDPVADMMREGEGPVAEAAGERGLQADGIVGEFDRSGIEVGEDDRVVAMRGGMYLVAGEYGEAPRRLGRLQGREVIEPAPAQLVEALDMEGDDVRHARVVDRHVRPVGMTGDRDEVELECRIRERVGERTVAIG